MGRRGERVASDEEGHGRSLPERREDGRAALELLAIQPKDRTIDLVGQPIEHLVGQEARVALGKDDAGLLEMAARPGGDIGLVPQPGPHEDELAHDARRPGRCSGADRDHRAGSGPEQLLQEATGKQRAFPLHVFLSH